MSSNLPLIICLMGPTAAGKTQLALELATKFPCDIISVDSAMVYRGLDIGTAKPTLAEQKMIPHRLIDLCDPSEIYSAGRFCQDALNAIHYTIGQHRIPLLVGGTMMYFHALQNGLAELPPANESIRQQIMDQANQLGWPSLHEQLNAVDPVTAAKIHHHDSQRISRALEIYMSTGQTASHFFSQKMAALPYQFVNFAIAIERPLLQNRIAQRFADMLKKGFIEEVEQLFQRSDLNPELPAIRTVGYRQAWQYLNDEMTHAEMQERAIIATRQLAKRQMTWLRNWKNLNWIQNSKPLIDCLSAQ